MLEGGKDGERQHFVAGDPTEERGTTMREGDDLKETKMGRSAGTVLRQNLEGSGKRCDWRF